MRPRCIERNTCSRIAVTLLRRFENIDRPTDWKWSFNYAGEFSQIELGYVAGLGTKEDGKYIRTFVVT